MMSLRGIVLALSLMAQPALAQERVAAPAVDSAFIGRLYELRELPMQGVFLGKVECTHAGPQAYINTDVIGTDSLLEIVAHETIHINQFKQWKGFGCPTLTLRELIDWEIEAYCHARPMRMARTRKSRDEADAVYVEKLRIRFGVDPPMAAYLLARYTEQCP